MCGIAGFLNPLESDPATLRATATRMSDVLAHRGPDGEGVWVEARAGLALAHRRLAIVDLSVAGAQPMVGHSGRFVISLNGEIYNYEELRRALPVRDWRGHSDTEVLLEAISEWGLETALQRSVGMFAFALWDRERQTLTLARDRFGEKPLYFGVVEGVLLFGSEMKALRAHPRFVGEIDRAALDAFLQLGCVPAPCSIYQGLSKLPPASFVEISAKQGQAPAIGALREYWSLERVAGGPRFALGFSDAAGRLDVLLRQAVAGQMVADVPVGAFLSGGVDSSLVVALMQEQSMRPVKTFSIGFAEEAYDEATHARAIAKHLGTDHTELYASPAQAQQVIPGLASMYDEPFADSSQIPTAIVARLARECVTVSLSGDGADELFGGYNRHVWFAQHGRQLRTVPHVLRRIAGAIAGSLAPQQWDIVLGKLLGRHSPVRPGEKMQKLALIFGAANDAEMYQSLIAQPSMVGERFRGTGQGMIWPLRGTGELAERMMLSDALGYLPDDILVKVDRAAMAVSLETRVPYLDHRVAEFAFQLPERLKTRGNQGKLLLRELLCKRVPKALLDRPKQGFGVPIDVWLRGPLKQWAADLLTPERLKREGYLDHAAIAAAWDDHQSGRRNEQHLLWNVLMFQSWWSQQH